MVGPRYTSEDLLTIRNSPLVTKPESLPSIEQWLDQDANAGRKPRSQSHRTDEAAPMGNFASTQQRPSPLQNRHSARAPGGDDIVLGPAKAAFGSSRSTYRLKDGESKNPHGSDHDYNNNDEAIEDDRPRGWGDRNSRITRDREGNSWTNVRGARAGRDTRSSFADHDKDSRWNARDQILSQPLEPEDGPNRPRWTRDGNDRSGTRPSGQNRGGWRDRQDGPKRGDRDQGRAGFVERDPEWMDQSTAGEDNQAHTALEFERWKERMRATKAQQDGKDKENMTETRAGTSSETRPAAVSSASTPAVPTTAGNKSGLNGLSLGTWGDGIKLDGSNTEHPPQRPTPGQTKAKASRFASLFNPAKDAASGPLSGLGQPQGPSHGQGQLSPAEAGSTSNEEQAGFQRMMQMLQGNSISAAQESSTARPPSGRPPNNATSPNTLCQQGSGFDVPPSNQPSRNTPTPGGGMNKDTEFLLNLIQGKGPSPGPGFPGGIAPPPGFSQQGPPPPPGVTPPHHDKGLNYGVLDRLNPTQNAPRPPPGFFDEGSIPQGSRMPLPPPPGFGPPPGHFPPPDGRGRPQGGFDGPQPPGSLGGFPPDMRFPLGGFGGGNGGGNDFMGGMPPLPPGFFGGPPGGGGGLGPGNMGPGLLGHGGPPHGGPGSLPPGFGGQPQHQHPPPPMGPEEGVRSPNHGQRGPPPGFGPQ